jgi:hypothetical protein
VSHMMHRHIRHKYWNSSIFLHLTKIPKITRPITTFRGRRKKEEKENGEKGEEKVKTEKKRRIEEGGRKETEREEELLLPKTLSRSEGGVSWGEEILTKETGGSLTRREDSHHVGLLILIFYSP